MKYATSIIGGLFITTFVLTILKAFSVIEWSWLWVTSFIWVPIALYVVVVFVLMVISVLAKLKRSRRNGQD